MENTLPVILTLFADSQEQGVLPMLKKEKSAIQDALVPVLNYIRIEDIVPESPRLGEVLTSNKHKIVILHFGGHALNNELFLEDQAIDPGGLADRLGQCDNIKLVFLNGCKTQTQAKLFLSAGVPAVIASTAPINDGKAAEFAKIFYAELGGGETLEESFKAAIANFRTRTGKSIDNPIQIIRQLGKDYDDSQFSDAEWKMYIKQKKKDIKKWKIADGFNLPEPPNEAILYQNALVKVDFPNAPGENTPTSRIGVFLSPNRILSYFEGNLLKESEVNITYGDVQDSKVGFIHTHENSFVLIDVIKDDYLNPVILEWGEAQTPTKAQNFGIPIVSLNKSRLSYIVQKVKYEERVDKFHQYRITSKRQVKAEEIIGIPLIDQSSKCILGIVARINKNVLSVKPLNSIYDESSAVHISIKRKGADHKNDLIHYLIDKLIKVPDTGVIKDIYEALEIIFKNPASLSKKIVIETKNYTYKEFLDCLVKVLKPIRSIDYVKKHNHFLQEFILWIRDRKTEFNKKEHFSSIFILYLYLWHIDKKLDDFKITVETMNTGLNRLFNFEIPLDKFTQKTAFKFIDHLRQREVELGIEFEPLLYAFIFIIGKCSLEDYSGSSKIWLHKCQRMFNLSKYHGDEALEKIREKLRLEEICEKALAFSNTHKELNWSLSGNFYFQSIASIMTYQEDKLFNAQAAYEIVYYH